ncbi:serine hydrolase [Psychrobacillus sp. OK032]|uniref:serine hydrolase domain-containing protein n=1 Tax=Psychrobacillus sp. OK032 TaxID=1884358 RepID=UPI0008D1FD35|nr:serine hydrolase domain-containing protein [Psychrobacillus sp. OK032]SER78991.1 CubicO group peptidase, beta-lactamase class C family [Psychrobacillus sp. OK032]
MNLTNLDIKGRMEDFQVAGLSITVIEKGQISMTECYGLLEAGTSKNVDSNSIFSAASISKFVTSTLVMKLSEKGILDLDEDVNKKLYSWKISENELTKNKKVTLRNLLSHQSGILDPEGSFAELYLGQEHPFMVELLEGRTSYCSQPIEVRYEPESSFHYSDAGFCIIQLLIEDVIGLPFKQVVDEHIFQPLNMKNSILATTIPEEKRELFSCGHNKNGKSIDGKYPIYPYPAAAGLWTTPKDLAILVIELMNSLKGESSIGLSASSALEMISPQGGKKWTGLGLFLDGSVQELEISSLGWGVGFQCMMVAYPYFEKGVVIMTNTDLGVHQLKGIIGEIYNSLTI